MSGVVQIGFMAGLKGAEKDGNFGSVGDIVRLEVSPLKKPVYQVNNRP